MESDLENMEVYDQCGKYDGNHGQQLDQDVGDRPVLCRTRIEDKFFPIEAEKAVQQGDSPDDLVLFRYFDFVC